MIYVRVSRGGEEIRRVPCSTVDEAEEYLADERRFALLSDHIVRGSPEDGWLTMRTDPELEPVATGVARRLDIIREEEPSNRAGGGSLRGALRRLLRRRSSG